MSLPHSWLLASYKLSLSGSRPAPPNPCLACPLSLPLRHNRVHAPKWSHRTAGPQTPLGHAATSSSIVGKKHTLPPALAHTQETGHTHPLFLPHKALLPWADTRAKPQPTLVAGWDGGEGSVAGGGTVALHQEPQPKLPGQWSQGLSRPLIQIRSSPLVLCRHGIASPRPWPCDASHPHQAPLHLCLEVCHSPASLDILPPVSGSSFSSLKIHGLLSLFSDNFPVPA